MNRMFGMMPSNEVEKERSFKDPHGLSIIIQAGPNGWTIMYSDGSSKWNDIKATTEENFEKAFKIAEMELGVLTKVEEYNEVISGEE